ncbi:RNA recognition motif-containing protein [Sinobacterium caligoides]|uniref:RNA recognition motif-containing protein n=1 Tax=Sinobacterium caligoides TaxID=933926 RepID=A0A3N2DH33_9GAMM|nr:RNA-binding protein [Sinobacterium caligoides]ROR98938.1 RNA recognition motif-containing protein [Sinobacterium caligoides]
MNIFVGNLSFDATEESIRDAFEDFGDVAKINLIVDQETGKPKGYGFVIMDNVEEAKDAIMALDGSAFLGRNINVNQAKPAGGGGRRGNHRQSRNHRQGGARNQSSQPKQQQNS